MVSYKNTKLKLIKLSVLFILSFYIYYTFQFESIQIIDGYTNKLSYFPNENCTLFINDIVNNHKRNIQISTLNNLISKKYTIQGINQDTIENPWKNGFGYKKSGTITLLELTSNIYQIDEKLPLIIKPNQNKKTDLLVVVPLLNHHANSNEGGKSFFAHNSSNKNAAVKLSMLRPLIITNNEILISEFVSTHLTSYNVGYIADYDLLFYKNIENTKMLLFYGNMPFISPQMRKNIDSFINKGGNILFANNTIMNNILRVDVKRKQLTFSKKTPNQWNDSIVNYTNYKTVGASYDTGYRVDTIPETIKNYINDSTLVITEKNHPIFKSLPINSNTIQIKCNLWNGPPLKGYNESFQPIIFKEPLNMYSYKVLAYKWSAYNKYKITIGAISEFRKNKNSGICINLGGGCWVEQIENEDYRNMITNSIDYLQKKSNK